VTIRIGIIGVTGRMGCELVKAVHAADGAVLAAAIARPGHPMLGGDVAALVGLPPCGVPIGGDLAGALAGIDVAIDFSRAGSVAGTVDACAAAGVALMIGTTGLDQSTLDTIALAQRRVPILVAANTSLALNVLLELVQRAARALPAGYDIEIFETHHRHKVDAPSGTALALGEAAAAGRGVQLPRPARLTGAAPGARSEGIGFAVARGGDVVGEHDVRFLGTGEQLRLSHVATDRAIFAHGAVAASMWLANQSAGRYRMVDFLFPEQ
jgi:4-hydroxy-tetrahydrodipicolinate reductase